MKNIVKQNGKTEGRYLKQKYQTLGLCFVYKILIVGIVYRLFLMNAKSKKVG